MFVKVTSGLLFAKLTSARLPLQPEVNFSIEVGISNINKEPPDWVALSDIYAFGVQYPVLGMVSRYAWYSAIASGV